MTEVTGEIYYLDMWIAGLKAAHHIQRLVTAAVIDQNKLPWIAQPVQCRTDALVKLR